ncbi:hypothetical protein R3I93_004522 [Phoxinus phoxinus]|uniref:Ig-like domain-containing protein n=1 Tax=Phoxinus phoxinus TaxID=58324 RepID=A0AAN9HE99_9TELE
MLVTFHCQALGWYPKPSVSWVVNASAVDRGDYNTSSLQDPGGFFTSTSVLELNAEASSAVECVASVSAAQQTSSVQLTVVAPQTTQDRTVVIAVMVSVCTIALLAALILVLLCCRKKWTKLSSENKFSSSSWTVNLRSERRSVADETRGKVNPGYNAEDVTSSGHGDLRNTADSPINIISPSRVPDIVIFSSQNQNKEDVFNLDCNGAKRTVRRVTTV